MRKHLFATMLLLAGMPATGVFNAAAEPVPQQQSEAATTIEGQVLDENNEPVIGASVVQKGVKGNGVATDAFGNFKIRVPKGAPLEFSYVGYKTVVVKASNGMTVYLDPTTEVLNELVAVGYGSQKRANLTGAVSTVDVARTMESRPQQDVMKALQGAVPGLTILNNTGNINGTPVVQIRGTGTLSATATPLYVVDGVAMDDISFLDPDEIKDISVLKDASSSSIYGARAAFGVILITTKSGQKVDKIQIKYNNNFGWSQAAVLPGIQGIVEQLEASSESLLMSGGEGGAFGIQYANVLPYARKWVEAHGGKKITQYGQIAEYVDENNIGDYKYNPATGKDMLFYADYDINKIMLNNATPSNQHNISLNGTTGKATFNAAFGYAKRQSLVNYNPDQVARYNAKLDLTIDVAKWLTAGARFSYSQRNVETRNYSSNIWGHIWRFPSWFQVLAYKNDEDGNPVNFHNAIGYLQGSTPIPVVNQYTRMQAWAKATIIPGLTLNADFTYAIFNNNCEYAYLPYKRWNTWGGSLLKPVDAVTLASSTMTKDNTHETRWTTNIYAAYDLTVAKDHNFKVMVGTNIEEDRSSYFMARTKQPLDVNLPAMNLYTGDLVAPSSSDSHWATAGFFGRINYDYKGKYLLEYNGRYDGSSRFPANDQWAYFQSGSIGWRFSDEEFVKPISHILTNGKLRASYGEIGNQAVGTNRFISTISTQNISWINHSTGVLVNSATQPALVSSSLTWERIRTTDVGLDFGLFNNQLYGSFDWYQRDTRDMLAPGMTLPGILGASAPYTNQGALRTRGWELSLGWNRSFGDFQVYATFNLANAKTTVTKWNNSTLSLGSHYSGKEYGVIWGFETDRYFTKDDFTTDENGKMVLKPGLASQTGLEQGTFHYGPGDIKYCDLDGDGQITGGLNGMYELDGKYYIPVTAIPDGDKKIGQYIGNALVVDDPTYAEIKKNKNANTVATGSVHNHGDIKKIGNSLPQFEYGFHVGGAWKGLDLDIFFQGVGKRDMWTVSSMVIPFTQSANDIYYDGMESHNSVIFNEAGAIVDYVVDQNNKFPRLWPGGYAANNVPSLGSGTGNYIPQSRYLQDISYLRVKNVTLGYTLPADWTSKVFIQRARIYFSGENLFFLHRGNKDTGFDPEIVTTEWSGGQTVGRANPIQRTYSFGIQVTL